MIFNTLKYPGQLIAILHVVQWLEHQSARQVAQFWFLACLNMSYQKGKTHTGCCQFAQVVTEHCNFVCLGKTCSEHFQSCQFFSSSRIIYIQHNIHNICCLSISLWSGYFLYWYSNIHLSINVGKDKVFVDISTRQFRK